ncbi:integrase arm-type DNA-binding domain-containing protein [uncultured Bartonella sp.]|uniref:integrase arm-type DNA-binding domain-containing protein n=1 Tax=uncultured Bartonella sp. TaxID=104108 RepID=UPI002606F1F7|nr:integrase arm-type DNA-binding domain-containing protein [uncultured Bartonella sp.]
MMNSKLEISEKSIAPLPFSNSGHYIVRDTTLKGFYVRVGLTSKVFIAHGEFWANGKRQFSSKIKIGEFGKMSARDARVKAKEFLAQMASGKKPGQLEDKPDASTNETLTLRQAWSRYKETHMIRKGRSSKTIEEYERHIKGVLSGWLDVSLADLGNSPDIVAKKHDEITKNNGPYQANSAMRTFRAIYNHAKHKDRSMPRDIPTDAVDWNEEKRRDTGMSESEIRPWLTELYRLDNPLRREFHLFLLLSGSRPTAIKTAKIEHINFRRRVLFVPSPKGGEKKAFEIPLSREMIRCLFRTIRLARIVSGREKPDWLFSSADSASGHIVEHKEDRKDLSKWGNDLRQTYRNLGVVAGVDHLNMHLLMNHSLPGVNAGYISRNRLTETVLRDAQQAISDVVMAEAAKDDKAEVKQDEVEAKKKTTAILNWLNSSRVILPSMSKSIPRE